MSGNHHVRFLGEEAAATPSPYPTGGNVWTNQFSELLSRRNYYRIKVVTAAHPFSRTNRWWSDGDTEFWQPDGSSIFKNAHPGSESCNLSLVNPDSAIPALFYHLNW